MDGSSLRWLAAAARALVVALTLAALLLQCYGLYLAAILAPHARWRRRLDGRFHRALITLDHRRVNVPR